MQVEATGDWQPLPTVMEIEVNTRAVGALKVAADLSRVQHSLSSQNVAFRILVGCPAGSYSLPDCLEPDTVIAVMLCFNLTKLKRLSCSFQKIFTLRL